MAASRQRDIVADESELWETLRLHAERAAAGEEMLRGFLDRAVLRHNTFASGLGLMLASKLALAIRWTWAVTAVCHPFGGSR
jgi:hypothetical protein